MSSGKKTTKDIVYLDNNATTLICPPAKKAYIDWLTAYNPSSDSKIAKPAKKLLNDVSDDILAHWYVNSATHTILFTSGATESNCYIIRACVKAYKKKLIEKDSLLKPHLILSSMEHHSSIECAKDLEENDEIEVTYVQPTIYGNILAEDVKQAIRPNTCLISIMFANNEVPIINNIEEIGEVAHQHNIPMHSDCVQIFGKFRVKMATSNIDVISASAHKFYGPKGIGLLIINNKLIEGYGLTAEINGSQQHHLRGGTENIAGIASMNSALKWCFANRKKKNAKLLEMRVSLLEKLGKYYTFNTLINYFNHDEKPPLELVSLGPPADKLGFTLPNTVLLAVVKNIGKPFCNVELKHYLDSKGIVISIGSACLTNDDHASHVLSAIGAPPVIKRGVLRISFGDYNQKSDIDKFISHFITGVEKQCLDITKEISDYYSATMGSSETKTKKQNKKSIGEASKINKDVEDKTKDKPKNSKVIKK